MGIFWFIFGDFLPLGSRSAIRILHADPEPHASLYTIDMQYAYSIIHVILFSSLNLLSILLVLFAFVRYQKVRCKKTLNSLLVPKIVNRLLFSAVLKKLVNMLFFRVKIRNVRHIKIAVRKLSYVKQLVNIRLSYRK